MPAQSQSTPAVSVIILNHNGLQDTEQCLASLRKDGFLHKEVIVIDNGSAVDESAMLRERWSHIARVIRSEKNLGYAGGNNVAATHANGKFLVLLNNDTEVTPGWIEPMLTMMQSDETIAACQPKVRSLTNKDQFDYAGACGGYIDALGFPYLRGRVFDTVEDDRGQYDTVTDIHWASGACMMVRRDRFRAIGGFDARLFAYMEEIDLCWRFRQTGHRILSVPSSVIYHRGSRVWKLQLHKKRFHEHRNNLLIVTKNVPWKTMFWLLPLRLAMEWVACLYYLSRFQFGYAAAAARSFFAFFAYAPRFLIHRHESLALPNGTSVIVSYFFQGKRTFAEITV